MGPTAGRRAAAPEPVTWVVGSRGLLGSAVHRLLVATGRPVSTSETPWTDPDRAVASLMAAAEQLLSRDQPWRVAWCAGAGVVGTSQDQLAGELGVLDSFLRSLRNRIGRHPNPPRSVFLASSAGGVYAGSSGAPFDETTPARPISAYGRAKLDAERLLTTFCADTRVPAVVGRIANLYGPGQDVDKPQGLITQLCRSQLTRQPMSIYVPLDTTRDYLFVDDAARLILAVLERVEREAGTVVKILASQQPVSLATILGELRRVTKRRPEVVFGASASARLQARDLRFRSVVWPELGSCVQTTLAAGVAATLESVGRDLRSGRFAGN